MRCIDDLLLLFIQLSLLCYVEQSYSDKPSVSFSSNRPNIIIFVADDLGWGDVGYHGAVDISTPNIDSLARSGIILNQYYSSPVCTPSRGALLSGYHPIQSGTQHYVIMNEEPWGFPNKIPLLPEYLIPLGYMNHAVGKWHLGFSKKKYLPTNRGFHSHIGYWSGMEDYFDHLSMTCANSECHVGLDFRDGLKPITNASGYYSTKYFTDAAVKIIQSHPKDRPLFLYVAHQAVHSANIYSNLQAPIELIDKFSHIKNIERRKFAAMLYALDESIGLIMTAAANRGFLNNSIVIFTSDNGAAVKEYDSNVPSNWPLRGTKENLWEGGIRVPSFIWSPLLEKTSYKSNALMHITDWMPTLLNVILTDQEYNEFLDSNEMYGQSFWQSLTKNLSSPRNEILHNIDPIDNCSSIRVGKWKLIQGIRHPDWSDWYRPIGWVDNDEDDDNQDNNKNNNDSIAAKIYNGIKCGPKPLDALTNCQPRLAPCLYDIESDPCEFTNLADKFPQVVDQLWSRIVALNRTAVKTRNVPIDIKGNPTLHGYLWTYWEDLS